MPEKLPNKSGVSRKTVKTVTLRHHHAKSYRKRHIGLLALFISAFLVLFVTAVQYRVLINSSINSSIDFVSDIFSGEKRYDLKIHSTYGFDITFDQQKFYASAIDATNGNLFLGTDVSESRPYGTIRIAPTLVNSRTSQSALTFTYHHETTYQTQKIPKLEDLQVLALSDGLITQSSFEKTASQRVNIDGHIFLKSAWLFKQSDAIMSQIKSEVVTYVAVVHNQPVTIVINYGLGGGVNDKLYQPIISSIRFGLREQAFASQSKQTVARVSSQRTLLDTILFNSIASAASSNQKDMGSEKIAALYGPAVAKIYNVYCMDISVNGLPFVTDACDGVMGSGFFVSQDGYLATNGHVATSDPKSLAILFAFNAYSKGDSSYLVRLLELTSLKVSDLNGKDDVANAGIMVDALYGIPDSDISKTNDVVNLLVELTDKSPDVDALLEATKARTKYAAQDTIKQAKLVASDYRALDGIDGFKASDMAIIKIDGSNYPVTKLGSISEVAQGANIYILGYPGNATDNGIVDSTVNTVTLTTGRVSSIKNASGSGKKLVETDTTIGHGNSGGPAFSDSGDVVGIATYTADGSGAGDGVYNYIRDIKDLQDLATRSSIKFDTASKTQSEWDQGIDYFYSAHYSQSIEKFKAVDKLYPNNSRVDEFVDKANKGIVNGEDIRDFPAIPVAIAAVVVLVGVCVMAFVLVRHKKHHEIYKNQVAQGNMQPFTPGAPAQQVVISPTLQPVSQSLPPVDSSATPVTVDQTSTPSLQPIPPVQPITPPVNHITVSSPMEPASSPEQNTQ